MKKTIYQLAFTVVCALAIASAVYAGGHAHDNCLQCNRAVGKKVNVMILADSWEKIECR